MNIEYALFLGLCLALTVITLWKPNMFVAFFTMIAWLAMLGYHLSTSLTGVTKGDFVDIALLNLYWVMGVAIFLITIQRVRGAFSGTWDDEISEDGTQRVFRGRRRQQLSGVDQYRLEARAAVRRNRSTRR